VPKFQEPLDFSCSVLFLVSFYFSRNAVSQDTINFVQSITLHYITLLSFVKIRRKDCAATLESFVFDIKKGKAQGTKEIQIFTNISKHWRPYKGKVVVHFVSILYEKNKHV
jgi:hypothetical protein